MRRTGKQKLRGQRGASLLLALLFTLAAAMVSMVIISASSAAVKRMYDDTQRQQEYLTLESAAKLLKAALENTTYKAIVVEEAEGNVITGYQPVNNAQFLAPKICDALNSDAKKATFTLPKPTGGDWPFPDVEMKITMDKEILDIFYWTATISLNLEEPNAQKLFLTAQSQRIEDASAPEPEEYRYKFTEVTLKTRLNESVASGGGGA